MSRSCLSRVMLVRDDVFVEDVITPAETRAYLIPAFRMLATKGAVRPRKRHGNIPL